MNEVSNEAIEAALGSVLSGVDAREPSGEEAVPEAVVPEGKPANDVDPLDFIDEATEWTPEAIARAKATLLAERKKANDLRKKAQNAHAAAEAREAKFKKNKQGVFAKEHSVQAREAMIDAAVKDLQKGDPDAFISAVGKLSGSTDPHKFWRDVSIKLASGGKVSEPEPAAVVSPEIQARLDQLEAHIAQQGRAETEQKINQLRHQQLQFAQTSAAHPLLNAYSVDNPEYVDQSITQFRLQEFDRTGRPISVEQACDRIEQELNKQYEILQRANGQRGSNGEREDTGPVPDSGRETSALAKPGMAASRPQTATTIPSSLTSEPAVGKRPRTRQEERQAIEAALPASFWAAFPNLEG